MECALDPSRKEMLGNCGGPVPGNKLLPVMVGDPVSFCPASAGDDPEVRFLADMVPSPGGLGLLANVPRLDLPPDMQDALDEADGWLADFRQRKKAG